MPTLDGFHQLNARRALSGNLRQTGQGSVYSQEERGAFDSEAWEVTAQFQGEAEALALVTTFRSVGYTKTVTWTPPRESSGTWIFRAGSFSVSALSKHDITISAVLVRDRQPGG